LLGRERSEQHTLPEKKIALGVHFEAVHEVIREKIESSEDKHTFKK